MANVATVAGIVVVLLMLDAGLALTAFVIPIVLLVVRAFQARSRPAYEEVRAAAAEATVRGQGALAGPATVQAYRLEDRVFADLDGANDRERRAERRTVRLAALFFPTVEFLGAASVAAVLGVGGISVLNGSVSVGTLAALLFYLRRVYDPITELSQAYDMAQAAGAAAQRIGETFRERPSVPDPTDPVPLPPVAGEVTLAGVRFGSGVRPVLRDVTGAVGHRGRTAHGLRRPGPDGADGRPRQGRHPRPPLQPPAHPLGQALDRDRLGRRTLARPRRGGAGRLGP